MARLPYCLNGGCTNTYSSAYEQDASAGILPSSGTQLALHVYTAIVNLQSTACSMYAVSQTTLEHTTLDNHALIKRRRCSLPTEPTVPRHTSSHSQLLLSAPACIECHMGSTQRAHQSGAVGLVSSKSRNASSCGRSWNSNLLAAPHRPHGGMLAGTGALLAHRGACACPVVYLSTLPGCALVTDWNSCTAEYTL